jgi:hypothetical protein
MGDRTFSFCVALRKSFPLCFSAFMKHDVTIQSYSLHRVTFKLTACNKKNMRQWLLGQPHVWAGTLWERAESAGCEGRRSICGAAMRLPAVARLGVEAWGARLALTRIADLRWRAQF